MKFRCRGLVDAGVELIPPDSPLFPHMLGEIRRHLDSPPRGSPPPLPGHDMTPSPDGEDPVGTILWNRSGKPLCAWTLIWTYRDASGHESRSSHVMGVGTVPSSLLPFGLTDDKRKFVAYWNTILPGSMRYLSGERVFGSNADVRAPSPEECWKGGVMRWGGGGKSRSMDQIETVTLALDAVFFSNGECAGPDEKRLWEHIVCDAAVYRAVATAAQEQSAAGLDAKEILAGIGRIIGSAGAPVPPPPPPDGKAGLKSFLNQARWHLARRISVHRSSQGDEKTVSMLLSWAGAELPEYRRI
jgi:hypothetical protein